MFTIQTHLGTRLIMQPEKYYSSSAANSLSGSANYSQKGHIAPSNNDSTRKTQSRHAELAQGGAGARTYPYPHPVRTSPRPSPPPKTRTILAEEALSDPWGDDVDPEVYHRDQAKLNNTRNRNVLLRYQKEFTDDWHRRMSYNSPGPKPSSLSVNPHQNQHNPGPVQLRAFFEDGGPSPSSAVHGPMNYYITNPLPGQSPRPVLNRRYGSVATVTPQLPQVYDDSPLVRRS